MEEEGGRKREREGEREKEESKGRRDKRNWKWSDSRRLAIGKLAIFDINWPPIFI